MQSIYNIEIQTIDGEKRPLTEYQGKVMLIVNVASLCGFTSQYEGLEALYQRYKDGGFTILAFPCNQFARQEPGTEEEIKNFCKTNYHVTFPLFAKIEVNGDKAHPLYQYLKSEKPGVMGTEGIKWNFTKFLVSRQGGVLERFAPATKPEDLIEFIEQALFT